MWKLCVYKWTEQHPEFSACYVFEFNTEDAALEAKEHFNRGDIWAIVIRDSQFVK